MPTYAYEAINSTGKNIKSTFEAKDYDEVVQMLRGEQLFPVRIEETTLGKEIKVPLFFNGVNNKDIVYYCRQLSTLLDAGIPLADSLEIIGDQAANKIMQKSVKEISEDVQKGVPFSEAMKKQNIFPELLIHMVAAGEISGTLNLSMRRMADNYEKDYKLQSKIKGAMIYPLVLAVVITGAVIFLVTSVLPSFVGMFESTNVELPGPTQLLLNISNFIRGNWFLLILVLILVVAACIYFIRSPQGKLFTDKMKLRIPFINNLVIKIATARFTRTLSGLLTSGIPLIQSMEYVASVMGNKIIIEKILKSKDEISKGADLTDSISRMNIFDPMVINMVKIGEESGKLDEILGNTADLYDEEVQNEVQALSTLIEPLMIVVMASVVGFIVISIIMPMFDMAKMSSTGY